MNRRHTAALITINMLAEIEVAIDTAINHYAIAASGWI